MYTIRNIHLVPSNGFIYAELIDPDGLIVISATLDYILYAIQERNYPVAGVSVRDKWGGIYLDRYEVTRHV